jgi:prepilin-type N-terminal cleavage/methylation domain-containing protein
MHKRSEHSQAFTLIELTVVILIIAILVGAIFTAGQGVIDRARKTQAKNDVTQIVTAVTLFTLNTASIRRPPIVAPTQMITLLGTIILTTYFLMSCEPSH